MTSVKVKADKKTGMFTVSYAKAYQQNETRYSLLDVANRQCDLMILLESSLHHQQKLVLPKLTAINADLGAHIKMQLTGMGYHHVVQLRERNEAMTILGVSIGRQNVMKELVLLIYIEKGALTQEFFNLYLAENDYMAGLNTTRNPETLLQEFSDHTWTLPSDAEGFSYTLYDTLALKYFYTGFDYSPFLSTL